MQIQAIKLININLISSLLLILIIPSLVSGPFLPDLFLSTIGILFLIQYFTNVRNKQYNHILNRFIIFFLIFYIIIIISSLTSENIIHSLESSLFYFRFGVFVLAVSYLLFENKKILNYIFIVALITFFVVSLDILVPKPPAKIIAIIFIELFYIST